MKNQKVRIAVIILCVLAAGFCYGFSRIHGTRTEGIYPGHSSVSQELADTEALEENGQIGPQRSQPSERDGDGPDDAYDSAGKEASLPCFVHICGEVVSPGVYELEEGSRVFQAVEKAGGFTDKASAESLNMAERINDGMKIVVLNKEEAEAAKLRGEFSSPEQVSDTGNSKVNLNTAAKEELMTLRGIGEAKADDIIRYRESHGGFKTIEDIMKISGIKEAAFQKIKEDITI